MLLSAEKLLCRNVQFVDIDYEKLMVNKKTAIQRTKEITELLEDVEFLSDEKAIQIRSKNYLAVGCDLKNLEKLDDTLRNEILPADCSVLCLAEVSLTYMDVQSANTAIAWASKLSDGQEQTTSWSLMKSLTRENYRCTVLYPRAILPRWTRASIRIDHDEALQETRSTSILYP